MISKYEFRSLDLSEIENAFDRKKWLKPFDYDSEWLGGFYEEPKARGVRFPESVSLHYGKRTGMKPLVVVSLTCRKMTKIDGEIFPSQVYDDITAKKANSVAEIIGLPQLLGQRSSDPVSVWRECFPDEAGCFVEYSKGERMLIFESDGLLVELTIGGLKPFNDDRYINVNVYDMELVLKNCRKSEQESTGKYLRRPDEVFDYCKLIESW